MAAITLCAGLKHLSVIGLALRGQALREFCAAPALENLQTLTCDFGLANENFAITNGSAPAADLVDACFTLPRLHTLQLLRIFGFEGVLAQLHTLRDLQTTPTADRYQSVEIHRRAPPQL
jgi:hypothetical protein